MKKAALLSLLFSAVSLWGAAADPAGDYAALVTAAKEGDPGPQGCGVITRFTLDLQGNWTGYPLTVHYVGLGNPDKPVIATGTVASPGATFTVLLPASCPHMVELYDSDGKLLASKDHDTLIPGDPTSKHLSF